MKKILVLITIIHSFAFCQKKEWLSYKESLTVEMNTTTLITGEKLLYHLFCIDNNNLPSQLSKVAYVRCLDHLGKEVFFNKHYLDNGIDSGHFFIPNELKTGNYKIIAYTKWMLNTSPLNYVEKNLLIINPYTKPDFKKDIFENTILSKDSLLEDPLVKKIHTKRERVTIHAFQSELKGNFLITVRKSNDINIINKDILKPKNTLLTTTEKFILPESKGELISGKLISSNNELPVEKIGIALTDKSNPDYLNTTSTNENGTFYFVLSQPLSSENIYIEAITPNPAYTIQLDSKITAEYVKPISFDKIKLKADYASAIEKRAIAAQIENAYFEVKKDSILNHKIIHTINKNYLTFFPLEKFSRFNSIKEFITEVLNQVYYSEVNDEFKIHFRNSGVSIEINEDPLTIVDGTLILNPNDLLKVDYKKIKSIAINNQPYYLGNKLYSGLFIVNTFEPNFDVLSYNKNSIKLNYVIPHHKQLQYEPNYIKNNELAKIPDYRMQLLWKTTTTLKDPVSFYTSDIEGTFEITVQGYTDSGTYINEQDFFTVK